MSLPLLASFDDVEVRVPAGTSVDEDRAEAAIEDASALIHAETNNAWIDDGALIEDIPAIAKTICCKAAIRALVNPAGVTQTAAGPFSSSFGDVYLTSRERDMLRGAAGKSSGLWTISTTRCEPGDLDDIYLEVTGSELIPHVPVGEVNW